MLLSTVVVPALAAIVTLAAGVCLGWWLLGRPQRHGGTRDLLVAGWLGWYLHAMLVLGVGWLGALQPAVLAALVAAPLCAAILDRRRLLVWVRGAVRDYRRVLRGPWWARLLFAALLGWAFLQLAAPPFHYDLLTYGFGQPAHWLAEGRIGPVGLDMFAYEAVPSRMHFVNALGLAGPATAGLELVAWLLAAALLTARALRRWAGARAPWPLLAGACLLATPALWDLLLLRKEDLAALWGGAALLLLASYASSRSRVAPTTIALAAAATLAAKPGVTAGFVGATLVFVWWRQRAPRWTSGLTLATTLTLALSPVIAHTWLGLGHPLAPRFPYLGRYDVASTRWYKALADAYPWDPGPLPEWPRYLLQELGRFYDPTRWNFGDNLGLIVLLLLPPALVAARRSAVPWLWLSGMACWMLTFHWPRFALVLLPLEIVAVVWLLHRLVPARVAAAAIAVAALAHTAFYAGLTVTGNAILLPALQATLDRTDPGFVPPAVDVCRQANERLSPAEHRILFVGETRAWPCRVPFDFWNAHFRHPFERIPHRVAPEVWWDRLVADRDITHVIYSPEVARRRMEWSESLHRRLERWMQQRGRILALARNHESRTVLIELAAPAAVTSRPRADALP